MMVRAIRIARTARKLRRVSRGAEGSRKSALPRVSLLSCQYCRAPELMRDSRIGSFGAVAIVFFLGLEIVALATMGEARRTAALWLAPGLARWAMVAVGWRIDYLRAEGAGTRLVGPGSDRNLA